MNRENRKFQVAAVQMDCVRYQKAANLKTAEALVGEAAQGGAKIIALPELFNTGYCVADADFTLAEPIPTGETTLWMESLCKQYGVFLTGAIIERDSHEGVLYDTHLLVGPEGYVGKYRKVCLWGDEQLRFREGSAYPVFDLGFAKVGLQICYEVGFPESARILALRGANLLIYSAAFGRARSYVWELASRARALENGVYVLAANRYGTENDTLAFANKSRIISPRGDLLAEGEKRDTVLLAEIDLDQVPCQRRAVPYLRDYKQQLFAREIAGSDL